MKLAQARQVVRRIIDEHSPADASTAHYVFDLPADRVDMAVDLGGEGRRMGFAARCQTGIDLFRPLVTLRCFNPDAARDLLDRLLVTGRPYIFFARRDQLTVTRDLFTFDNTRILQVHRLEPANFKPVVNVMVQADIAPDGNPSFAIQAGGLQARAGVNWRSESFAEIFVHTDEEARGRGWGKSVAAACMAALIKAGQLPLYLVDQENAASLELAASLGFVDTGARQAFADVVYVGA